MLFGFVEQPSTQIVIFELVVLRDFAHLSAHLQILAGFDDFGEVTGDNSLNLWQWA